MPFHNEYKLNTFSIIKIRVPIKNRNFTLIKLEYGKARVLTVRSVELSLFTFHWGIWKKLARIIYGQIKIYTECGFIVAVFFLYNFVTDK